MTGTPNAAPSGSVPPTASAPPPPSALAVSPTEPLEIYKMLVEMADRVSQRRQSNNNFYMTVNTAVVSATAYLATLQVKWLPTVAVAAAGAVICIAWWRSIQSYRTLNQAKFAVITDLEKHLSFQAYTQEWMQLTGGARQRHAQFHVVETIVPIVFGALHLLQLWSQVRWGDFFTFWAHALRHIGH